MPHLWPDNITITNLSSLMVRIGLTIESRSAELRRYRCTPRTFWLIMRDNKVRCVWVRNVKITDYRIAKIFNPQNGYTFERWSEITLMVASDKKCDEIIEAFNAQ